MILGLMRLSCSFGKMRSSDQARSSESKMDRLSYAPAEGEGCKSATWYQTRCEKIGAQRLVGTRIQSVRGVGWEGRHVPWPTNCFSNLSRNSRASLSSGESASSPTTAFIAAASRPIAYFAYYRHRVRTHGRHVSLPLAARKCSVTTSPATMWLWAKGLAENAPAGLRRHRDPCE